MSTSAWIWLGVLFLCLAILGGVFLWIEGPGRPHRRIGMFCPKCGKQLEAVPEVKGYETETGKPLMEVEFRCSYKRENLLDLIRYGSEPHVEWKRRFGLWWKS